MSDAFFTVLVAAGIPSTLFGAIIGILIWRGQRKAVKRENERIEKEKNRDEMMLFIFEGNSVSIALGKATAEAVRDKRCNGNVSDALIDATEFKKRQDQFFKRQGVKHLHDSA
jgi:hypothetical protein